MELIYNMVRGYVASDLILLTLVLVYLHSIVNSYLLGIEEDVTKFDADLRLNEVWFEYKKNKNTHKVPK
jgi:hypothetical protein